MKRLLFLTLSLCLSLLCACSPGSTEYSLEINVLNIGKADCIVIETGNKCVLIDTGEEENAPEILAFLEQKNIREIDTVILSHFDKDHIGGMAEILKYVSVKNILECSFPSDRKEYGEYHQECETQGLVPNVLTEPYQFAVSDCVFTVLPPEKERYDRKQDNNASMIVTLEHGNNLLAFFGDAMEERLEEFMAASKDRFRFVKLPYHGNYLKNYERFLDQTDPDFAAVTCSQKNPADEETLSLLKEKNVKCYLTQNGNVKVLSDGKSVVVKQ